MTSRPTRVSLDPEARRDLAIELFNYTWTWLEKPDRTEAETERMINAAHASRLLWEEIGEPIQHARGEWQISRAYAVAGQGQPALRHALRCMAICEEHGIADFDLAYAYEGVARAYFALGDKASAAIWAHQAGVAGDRIADPEDRSLLIKDLATISR
jgi:hypothetical protein